MTSVPGLKRVSYQPIPSPGSSAGFPSYGACSSSTAAADDRLDEMERAGTADLVAPSVVTRPPVPPSSKPGRRRRGAWTK